MIRCSHAAQIRWEMKTSATINQPGDVRYVHRRSDAKRATALWSAATVRKPVSSSSPAPGKEERERAFCYIGQGRWGGLQSAVVLLRHPPTHLIWINRPLLLLLLLRADPDRLSKAHRPLRGPQGFLCIFIAKMQRRVAFIPTEVEIPNQF